MTSPVSFGIVDYVVFGVMLILSILIGIFYSLAGDRQRTSSEYLYGNRKMSVIPVAISMVVSFISPITLQGTPAEVYLYGLQYSIMILGMIVSTSLCIWLYPPLFYPLQLESTLQYYELRYDSKMFRKVACVFSIYSGVMYSGVVIYGPAIALQALVGAPVWASMLGMVLCSTLYTALGGIKAVVWSDVLQSVVMFAGVIAMVVVGTIKVGGVHKVWELLEAGNRTNLFSNLSPDPTERQTVWSLLFGDAYIYLAVLASQTSVQRYTSVRSLCRARMVLVLFVLGGAALYLLSISVGAVVYAYYAHLECDPLQHGTLTNVNQLTPYFVADVLRFPGIPGLFMASIFAASLSTLSSTQNAMAGIIWMDLIQPCTKKRNVIIIKLLVVLVGLLTIACGFLASTNQETLLKITALMGSGPSVVLAGIFIAGALSPYTSLLSSLTGAAIAFSIHLWQGIGGFYLTSLTPPLPTSTDNCTWPENNNTFTEWVTEWDISTTSMYQNYTSSRMEEQGIETFSLDWFYRISHLVMPMVSFSLCIVISLLLSCFPCCRHKGSIPNKYLFHVVRYCRPKSRDDDVIAMQYSRPSYHQVEVIRSSIEDLAKEKYST